MSAAENGIFTSDTPSSDWQTVHGLFPRGFNQLKIQHAYFPIIVKKTNNFVAEWSRWARCCCCDGYPFFGFQSA
jgi:hypothetical protein